MDLQEILNCEYFDETYSYLGEPVWMDEFLVWINLRMMLTLYRLLRLDLMCFEKVLMVN